MINKAGLLHVTRSRREFCRSLAGASAGIAALGFSSEVSWAKDSGVFKDKKINLIVGYNPGGTYDIYSRTIADWLPRYIPGHPTIVVQNMPGAGGAKAANYLYSDAAKDGFTIGMISQASALQQIIEDQAVHYDAAKFEWLGRATSITEVSLTWHTSPTKTFSDALDRQTVMACTGVDSTSFMMPTVMNRIVGAKFKLVHGYAGTTGCLHAMEQGETEGAYSTAESLLIQKRQWLDQHLINVIVQYSLKRHPAFPNVPAMVELGKTPDDKKLLSLFGSTAEIGRSIIAPPGAPADRVAALRNAFNLMTADPKFKAELQSRNMEFAPMSGIELQKLVSDTLDVSPTIAKRAATAVSAT